MTNQTRLGDRVIRVVVDTETTGLGPNGKPPRDDGVVQIGWAWEESGAIHSAVLDVNPGEAFLADGRADEALKVNKFTPERVRAAPPAVKVSEEVRRRIDEIAERMGGRAELYAYNAPFDRWFLTRDPWNWTLPWGPDIMEQAIRVLNVQATGRLQLAKALALAGIANGNAHDAEGDAIAELKLLNWLIEKERTAERVYSLEQMAADIHQHVLDALVPAYSHPAGNGHLPGEIVSPSTDLTACPLELWRKAHGVPTKEWGLWSLEQGTVGYKSEDAFFEQLTASGIRVMRGNTHALPPIVDPHTRIYGKLDGLFEFPIGSGQWHLVDVKSTSDSLGWAMKKDPWEKYVLQLQAYMTIGGYDHAFIAYYSIDKSTKGQWALMPLRSDPKVWARIVDICDTIRRLREPDAPEPQCSCGRCGPPGGTP